jgi:hypothetical protein
MAAVTLINPPLEATNKEGAPVLLLAFLLTASGVPRTIVVTDNGQLGSIPVDSVQLDWRYDWNKRRWIDASIEANGEA